MKFLTYSIKELLYHWMELEERMKKWYYIANLQVALQSPLWKCQKGHNNFQ